MNLLRPHDAFDANGRALNAPLRRKDASDGPRTPRLMSELARARRRAELLAGLGVDAVCMVPFTLEFSRIDPDEFVRTVLVEKLHARDGGGGGGLPLRPQGNGRRATA